MNDAFCTSCGAGVDAEDNYCRLCGGGVRGATLPVGVMTAIVGVPIFLVLLRSRRL
jgi:ABC-type cobalamin transport system permease subunit